MPYTYQYPHPAVTVDACLFTIQEDLLKILLIRRALDPCIGDRALPGGFVQMGESSPHTEVGYVSRQGCMRRNTIVKDGLGVQIEHIELRAPGADDATGPSDTPPDEGDD